MADKDPFIQITNKMIYDEIQHFRSEISRINRKANINSALISFIILVLCAVIARIF